MKIETRNRSELRQYFIKNAIPTEANFADLVDGMLNQQDDRIYKPSNDALSIEAVGDPTSQKKVLHFYNSFSDTDPSWTFSLNPRQNSNARQGFSISDSAGNSRLFIDRETGRIGIGIIGVSTPVASTLGPVQAALHIDRGATNDLGLMLSSSGPGWGSGLQLKNTASGAAKTFGIYTGGGALHFADVDASADRMVISSGGNVGFGTTAPQKKVHVQGAVSAPFLNDQNDRPGIAVTGYYPEITLFSNVNNTNHGPTIRIGSSTDGTASTFKQWVIGTAGRNAAFLDIGFSDKNDPNPHAGIRNYNGRTILTIKENGTVGIGTTDPASDLTIRRDSPGALGPVFTLLNTSGSPGAGGAIDFNGYNVGTSPPTLRLQSLDDGNFSSHLAIFTKNSGAAGNALAERMRVSSNGNVTFYGDLALRGKHALRGNDSWLRLNQDGAFTSGTHTPGLFAPNSMNVGGSQGWEYNPGAGHVIILGNIGTHGFNPTGGGKYPSNWGGGIHTWDVVCEATVGYSALQQWSSVHEKTEIRELPDALATLDQLNPILYERSGKSQAGFIAEEVLEVFAHGAGADDNFFAIGIHPDALLALAISAVQELSAHVRELSAERGRSARAAAPPERRIEVLREGSKDGQHYVTARFFAAGRHGETRRTVRTLRLSETADRDRLLEAEYEAWQRRVIR